MVKEKDLKSIGIDIKFKIAFFFAGKKIILFHIHWFNEKIAALFSSLQELLFSACKASFVYSCIQARLP